MSSRKKYRRRTSASFDVSGAHPSLADIAGELRAKAVPPKSHHFMADVDAALAQQVLHLPLRQGITHVHHYRHADPPATN
jgi:hypothetical protein